MASADFQFDTNVINVPASAFTLDGFTQWTHSEDFPRTSKICYVQGQVIVETIAYPNEMIGIYCPPTANTLEGFSEWVYSEDFPQSGKISFINGRIIIDMSPERYEFHNKLKTELSHVLVSLIKENDLGEFYTDGARIKNPESNISNEPDAMFASWKTLESGKFAPPADHANDETHVDMVGTPDWVCEVVSDSSIKKDTRDLREAYHKAGISEYWLIDARGEEVDFLILVHQPDGYSAAANEEGWIRSPVFDRQFQLTRSRNRVGSWKYDLQQRLASDQ